MLTACAVLVILATASTWAEEAPAATAPAATAPAATAPATGPAGTTPTETQPDKAKTVPLSFTNAPLAQIAKFLTENMDKPVLIDKEVEKTQITVVNPKPLPVEEALFVLTTALHEQGVAIEERERTIHLIPITEIVRRQIDTVPAEVDVATITPTNRIVRKIFELRHHDPARLIDVLKPLIPAYGHIVADTNTRKLIIVSPVDRLITLSRIIEELDKPDVSGGELRVFPIQHVDIFEVIPTLEKLIAGYLGSEVKATTISGGPGSPPSPDGQDKGKPAEAGGVAIKADKTAVLLIPEARRSAIVVAAPSNVLSQIEAWLKILDQPKPPSTQWEIIEVRFGDPEDLSERLTAMLAQVPEVSLRNAVRILPFPASRRMMIFGSEQNRETIKKWLAEIDVEDTGTRITRTFELKHADAQQIADNIKELFGPEGGQSRFRVYYYDVGRRGGGDTDRSQVTVTANVRRNTLTVVASPEKMPRIAEQIEEWDKPLEDEAAPLIITLKYADPAKTKELLDNLFSKKERSSMPWWWYDGEQESTTAAVGRLFGQFRFEAYPDTGKLIVVSKTEENYAVIRQMIEEIDRPQEAGLPRTIQLKFADAETVAEQLNALLNAPGTPTSILRRGRLEGFEQFADDRSPYNRSRQTEARPSDQQQQQDQSQTVMRFWWQEPADPNIKARQPSNLVGKLRIVPNIERNLLLVAVPEEYSQAIDELVNELDQPGYQVLIRAAIAEVSLEDAMSLGFRFSTDAGAFTSGDPLMTDNALRGLFSYQFEDMHANTHTFTVNADVNGLLSLLRRITDLKIRSEPKILTADNVEAEFFDGQDIPFLSSTRLTDAGNRDDSFDYFPVGITLRVRPHITEEKSINLTVKLRVSSVVPGRTLFGGAIVDRRETTTQILLEDGRTFMISGILREEERAIIRSVPGLGDIPGLGEIFKHRETAKVNTELLVFLTPYVIGPRTMPPASDPIEKDPMDRLEQHWPSEDTIGETENPAPPSAHVVPTAADTRGG